MTSVVVLGGGFAGVTAALHLVKKIDKSKEAITLIDQNTFHLFTPALYEVATSEQPQKNIAIPFRSIFGNKLKVITNTIELIDLKNNKVVLKNKKSLPWDYMIITLGSQPAYFDIPGMEKHSISLKNLSDAVQIKNNIKKLCEQKLAQNQEINLVVAGGGFSGTELAAELTNYKNRLSKANPQFSNLIKITVIEEKDRLLTGLDEKVSSVAKKRLEKYGVNLVFNCQIKQVTQDFIEAVSGQKYPYDLLIWAGGVRASSVLAKCGFKTNTHGQVKVNQNLQVEGYKNIFAAGDCAEYLDPKTSKPVPGLGQIAIAQGKVAGENVYRQIHSQKLVDYHYKNYGYLVPLRARFVVASLNFVKFSGFPAWILQQLVFLRYLIKILPLYKAFKKWNKVQQSLVESLDNG